MGALLADSSEPSSLAKSGDGIRNASSWEEVCARLNDAQVTYTQGDGTAGKLKRMRRKVADNMSQPAAHIAKMVPDIDPWTTPVAGTVGILLQAMDTAAKTREDVLTSLSDLDKTFSNIDSFAATFPTDQNVRKASVSLVVAIFQAVEHAIVFFTKSAGRKAAAAVFKGGDYQKELLNSFNEVQKRSDYLIQKAQNSHYESTRVAIREILSREDRLLAGQAHVAQQSADMKNTILSLMDVVKELGTTLSKRDKSKADQVLQTELFQQWMACLEPAKLLIHGNFRGSTTVSPLSLLTATLTEAARADQHRLVSLVFFCGCHLDREEDTFSGGRALMQMLISQLLQQQPHTNISPSPWELDMDRVRQVHQLCQLFNLLVHRLPGEVTLFCLIDGMVYYERDEFIDEMHYVLTELMRLVGDPTTQANVKLLVTSPWRTEMAQQFFQEDREILYMEGMQSRELTPSASRVIHRHISHTESDQSSRETSPEPWE
ncbi:hypothetical protein INS49_009419 [Diaporthe citri]|uniref:uncharacterized protein n=1 Tax=Diaporthe citri TaxID=83186 RepID=UPI001C7FFF19|nr:uncharacterized protein INS49_009419 [Diaporthe citri]KAG6361195.1 hypothetical protein INS49_009419 [Diaporthe citri]